MLPVNGTNKPSKQKQGQREAERIQGNTFVHTARKQQQAKSRNNT